MVYYPDIKNLEACTQDITEMARYQIALIRDQVEEKIPEDITDFGNLLDKLSSCHHKLPMEYLEGVYEPFIRYMNMIGEQEFSDILTEDPHRERGAGFILDIAHAIIQNGGCYCERQGETDAFHEMISDLFSGFLSDEVREEIKSPDYCTIAPLPKWGGGFPYTWTTNPRTWRLGFKTLVVNLPLATADRGLLSWGALPHETGGHDIICSDEGLLEDLEATVKAQQEKEGMDPALVNYWTPRIGETAADVLGILNMGPAAGMAVIGLLRGLNAAGLSATEEAARPVLSDKSPAIYPSDLLRGYLAAYTTGLLSFSEAKEWEEVILAETEKDLNESRKVEIGWQLMDIEDVKRSVAITARAISQERMPSLENHCIAQLQDWHDHDEKIVNEGLRPILAGGEPLREFYPKDTYATHAVAAGVVGALAGDAEIPVIFGRMKEMLRTMHNSDPSMNPLALTNPIPRIAWHIKSSY